MAALAAERADDCEERGLEELMERALDDTLAGSDELAAPGASLDGPAAPPPLPQAASSNTVKHKGKAVFIMEGIPDVGRCPAPDVIVNANVTDYTQNAKSDDRSDKRLLGHRSIRFR